MSRVKIVTTVLLLVMLNSVYAQFTVDGQFRARLNADHGYKMPTLEESDLGLFVDQRTRLNLSYKTEKLETKLSLQDARVWGEDEVVSKTGAWGSSSSFEFHEAWFKLNLNDNSSLKIGRQEWNYDNIRLLSARNWSNDAMSYDALLYEYKKESLKASLGLSYNNTASETGSVDDNSWNPDRIKTLNFLHINKSFNKHTNLSLLFAMSGRSDTANNKLLLTGTYGGILSYNKSKEKTGGLFAGAEGYYQHGNDLKKLEDGTYRSISAYLLAGDIGYRTANKKVEVSAGAELLSGHDYANNDEVYSETRHSFDILYGGRFPFYGGNMNHFLLQDSYSVGTKDGGYFDPYLKLKYSPNKKSSIQASWYMPTLTTNVAAHTDINPSTNKPSGKELDANGNQVYWKGNLGNYFDLQFIHKYSKTVMLKAGLSYAIVSDIKNQMVYGYEDVQLKQLHDLGQNYFGWVMIVVKPRFFQSEVSAPAM